MQKRRDSISLLLIDYVSASVAWAVFYLYRKYIIEEAYLGSSILNYVDANLLQGAILIPFGWLVLYQFSSTYKDIYRKSRLNEIGRTLLTTLIGVVIIFFILVLDDEVTSYTNYYSSFTTLFIVHFTITAFLRSFFFTFIAKKVKDGRITFNTLLIGGNLKAVDLYKEITNRKKALGYQFVGFVDRKEINGSAPLKQHLNRLGNLEDIPELLKQYKCEEVIIALDTHEHPLFLKILELLNDAKVIIKIIPDMYDIMIGNVKMQQIFGAILIEIYPEIMPQWQRSLKRILDLVFSSIAIFVLAIPMLYIMIRVKLSSPGPIFFKQERIGYKGKPFNIYKFRSMVVDAEPNGPELSSNNDERITKWGKVMRKYRLDEIPQFFNVILGEMSLVGPRPERRHFIDQILEKAPNYKYLLKVKPGITSWGQVKFGYAENVDQMVQRLKFDILYIENMSILVDFKIMIYTLLIILDAKGK